MNTWRTGILAAATLFCVSPAADAQQAVYLIRHADRLDNSADTPLSVAGEARAAALAAMLKDAGIGAIYVTEYQRTAKTAAPLAAALNIAPVAVPARDTEALVKRVKEQNGTDVVLIVGHDVTVPRILKAFGAAGEVRIGPAEFDNLFVVVPQASSVPVVLRLRY